MLQICEYSTTEPKNDIAEGRYGIKMLDDDESSGSASSDSTSETTTEDTQPPEDVRNTACMLQNTSKSFL